MTKISPVKSTLSASTQMHCDEGVLTQERQTWQILGLGSLDRDWGLCHTRSVLGSPSWGWTVNRTIQPVTEELKGAFYGTFTPVM